jgi:hypothetical protein
MLYIKCISDIEGFEKGRHYKPVPDSVVFDILEQGFKDGHGFHYNAYIYNKDYIAVGIYVGIDFEYYEPPNQGGFSGSVNLDWINQDSGLPYSIKEYNKNNISKDK